MLRVLSMCILAVLGTSNPLRAGKLFDDYLNPVRPGPGTAPGDSQAVVAVGKPVGQRIVLPADAGEIYRIGVRPIYESWKSGESVTMTLYDSSAKKNRLASYTIDEATSHVSLIYNTKDRVLFFQMRARTSGKRDYYFEMTVQGGDGVAFQAFRKDAYAGGQATGAAGDIRDLSFLCHIKPKADREENLKAFFTQRLNVERPELKAVKAAVEAKDWEKAIAETVKHFHARTDIWNEWKDSMTVAPKADADTALPDLILKNQLRHKETKQPIPWRPESYWVPEYPVERAQPNHATEPSPFLWHFDRELGGAYTDTGRKEYARKAIDLRMQFILDNPSPKKTGLPWYFELWNDRTAAGRAPGHGTLAYARLYNYDGWTNDEKLVFFSFLEDCAAWTYKAESGANWGAEASRACYEFGLKFPEWKMSPEYVNWGTQRLATIVLEDVRGDGTSTEAAIKYHSMVARRLKGLLEDQVDGKVKFEKGLLESLKRTVERMYEVMAYTLQPHNYVVMCGDSWYENYSDELVSAGKLVNRPDFVWIGTQGKEGKPPREISKVFPGGGYFIMRSDFGGEGEKYQDARQLFIHNGNWFGSHGHFDLTSINLYAYGRPIIVDPGQYDYQPPPGIDTYWASKTHSMLVADGRDVKREAGPSEWTSNSLMDWYDGIHYGYRGKTIQTVRRRVVFMKPNYFLVDDSAVATAKVKWAQVWNLADPDARIDAGKGMIHTTFKDGGNVVILNQDPSRFGVETNSGITSSKDAIPKTRIIRLGYETDNPRYQTLLYPYAGTARPDIDWKVIQADASRQGDLTYAVQVRTSRENDRLAFGKAGSPVTIRGASIRLDADFAAVRLDRKDEVVSFAWARGRMLALADRVLAQSDAVVHDFAAVYKGDQLVIHAPEPDATLKVAVGSAKSFEVNGSAVKTPVIKDGFFHPFGHMPRILVADDRDHFEYLTKTEEWERKTDPRCWAGGCTIHETDPGRHESGNYIFDLSAPGRYRVEVHVPDVSVMASERVEYVIRAGGTPASVGGAVVDVRNAQNICTITVNMQAAAGWVGLGEFALNRGKIKILSRNATEIDGLYFVADAMRLVPLEAR